MIRYRRKDMCSIWKFPLAFQVLLSVVGLVCRPSCVVSVAMDSKWEMIFELEDLLTTFLAVESNLPTNMVVSF